MPRGTVRVLVRLENVRDGGREEDVKMSLFVGADNSESSH